MKKNFFGLLILSILFFSCSNSSRVDKENYGSSAKINCSIPSISEEKNEITVGVNDEIEFTADTSFDNHYASRKRDRRNDLGACPRGLQGKMEYQRNAVYPYDELCCYPTCHVFDRGMGSERIRCSADTQPRNTKRMASVSRRSEISDKYHHRCIAHRCDVHISQVQ